MHAAAPRSAHLVRLVVVFGLASVVSAIGLSRSNAEDGQVYKGMAVSVIKAEQRCLKDTLPVSGVFIPKAEVQVRPDREGLKISQVLVEAGDTVGAGQILARLILQQPNAPAQTVTMRSPASGVAIGTSAIVGSYASPNAPEPMFRIIVDGELDLKGEVLAADLSRLHVDQTAIVKVQGIGQLDGRITSIDRTIDALTQLGSVHVAVAPDPRLRSGVFARADVAAGETCGVAIPLSAVLYESDGAVVQVVRDDHVETRRVSVGALDQGIALIKDGLGDADLVIARAGGFLRDGDRVRPFPLEVRLSR